MEIVQKLHLTGSEYPAFIEELFPQELIPRAQKGCLIPFCHDPHCAANKGIMDEFHELVRDFAESDINPNKGTAELINGTQVFSTKQFRSFEKGNTVTKKKKLMKIVTKRVYYAVCK